MHFNALEKFFLLFYLRTPKTSPTLKLFLHDWHRTRSTHQVIPKRSLKLSAKLRVQMVNPAKYTTFPKKWNTLWVRNAQEGSTLGSLNCFDPGAWFGSQTLNQFHLACGNGWGFGFYATKKNRKEKSRWIEWQWGRGFNNVIKRTRVSSLLGL